MFVKARDMVDISLWELSNYIHMVEKLKNNTKLLNFLKNIKTEIEDNSNCLLIGKAL